MTSTANQPTPPVTPKPDTLTSLLNEIESRANAATPPPWHVADDPLFPGKLHCIWGDMVDGPSDKPWFGVLVSKTCFAPNSKANAEFQASARTDLPKLVKALRIVLARHDVERNQTDGVVHGVHLTDLDYQNIRAAILTSPENGEEQGI